MKSKLIVIGLAVLVCGYVKAADVVTSYVVPKMVEQINAAFLNLTPSTVTLTDGSTIGTGASSGTARASVSIQPVASAGIPNGSRKSLLSIGDNTGTAAFGFASPSNTSYGVMACFGRTAPATALWDGNYDTALDARTINRMTNNAAYNMRGGYIKVKNYTGAVVGQMDGLTVEAVADGTEAEVSVLKLGSDGSSVEYGIDMSQIGTAATADIIFSEGALIRNTSSSLLTITEGTVDVVGAFTASSIAADNGISTNITILAATNYVFNIVGGIITNITTAP